MRMCLVCYIIVQIDHRWILIQYCMPWHYVIVLGLLKGSDRKSVSADALSASCLNGKYGNT